jgi:type I restriction enzyme M protein
MLGDFDIKKVLKSKSKDYFEFTDKVESKEKIKELAGDVPSKTLKQLERFWEKYATPLRAIEDECAKAEKKMNSYLKELGYE